MGVFICQKSSSCVIIICAFYCKVRIKKKKKAQRKTVAKQAFTTRCTWREKPKQSQVSCNSLFDLLVLAHREGLEDLSTSLDKDCPRGRRRRPPAPRRQAWVLSAREPTGSLPSSRKDRTHCSTAAVCSRRASGMLSGANSTFMLGPGRGQRRLRASPTWLLRGAWEECAAVSGPRAGLPRAGEREAAAAAEQAGAGLRPGGGGWGGRAEAGGCQSRAPGSGCSWRARALGRACRCGY